MLINQDFSPDRTKYIGGSDIGAILGLSRFRSPLEVWMEKTGKDNKRIDSLPLRFGSFAEEFVASEYSRATGFELVHNESIFVHPEHSFMSAHIDRFVLETADATPSRILECKTANPFNSSEWGEVGSDEVPMSYLCQCIWYMAITNINRVDLAVLFGNSDFRIYEIARDKALEDMVIGKAIAFWHDYVLKDIAPPPINEADYHHLYQTSKPDKYVEATQDTYKLVQKYHSLNGQIEVMEMKITQIKQSVMEQMQDAELLTFNGKTLATWKATKQSYRLDSKRLETDYPELVVTYQVPIQNPRRLVIKRVNK